MAAPDAKTSESPLARWLTPQTVISVLSLSVALAGAYASLKSDLSTLATLQRQHDKRIEDLEHGGRDTRELLLELRGDVKALRQVVESERKPRP